MSTKHSKLEVNTTENLEPNIGSSSEPEKSEHQNQQTSHSGEVELHLYHTGTAAIFYKPKMSEEEFKIAMQLNSLLQKAYKKGMRFKFTMDIQLQLNLPL